MQRDGEVLESDVDAGECLAHGPGTSWGELVLVQLTPVSEREERVPDAVLLHDEVTIRGWDARRRWYPVAASMTDDLVLVFDLPPFSSAMATKDHPPLPGRDDERLIHRATRCSLDRHDRLEPPRRQNRTERFGQRHATPTDRTRRP